MQKKREIQPLATVCFLQKKALYYAPSLNIETRNESSYINSLYIIFSATHRSSRRGCFFIHFFLF